MRILVAGATGFIGSNLVPALDEAGHDVRALARHEYEGPAEAYRGDLTDYDSFADALEGMDAAYYLVHSMSEPGDFSELEETCAEHFVRACNEHGVDRIVYLGGIVHHDAASKHLVSRTTVGDILREAEADVTELRAAMVLGWQSSSFQIMYQLVSRLPVMLGPRWLDSRSQPIHIDDAVAYLCEVLDHEATRDAIYEIGGDSVHTYRELLTILAEKLGRQVHIVTVPFLTPFLSSLWVELVADQPRSLVRALIESLRADMVVQNGIDDVIDRDCLTYREALDRVLAERDD
ncbi:MAG: NAD(P)H-binding protein [Candidatus Nanohaloarchaea archaeon]|nr:NAD(P)H-binding protein [Candidatus Nanohaloarchaea archaeon]